jgi:hypothetical protein
MLQTDSGLVTITTNKEEKKRRSFLHEEQLGGEEDSTTNRKDASRSIYFQGIGLFRRVDIWKGSDRDMCVNFVFSTLYFNFIKHFFFKFKYSSIKYKYFF